MHHTDMKSVRFESTRVVSKGTGWGPGPKAPALDRRWFGWTMLLLVGLLGPGLATGAAATIFVPNGSFEAPETPFADPDMDAWQKSSAPVWYDDHGGTFPWEQVMGQFRNASNGSPSHIDNLDGNQAAYLFALPEAALFQDNNTLSGTNATPTRDFNVKFSVGRSYTLTVGLLGGGGGMSNGATFAIRLYYRDAAHQRVTVAATTITNGPALFPTNTHLTDFQVRLPTVTTNDAWAGKNIGIELASTTGFDLIAGYWDIDDVRLVETIVPNGSFESPGIIFAGPEVDDWQKSPQPAWYNDQGGFFPWTQVMGLFVNTSNGSPDHIDNVEGRQALYLFALPEAALFQDYTSLSGTNPLPTHDFNTRFEVGTSYALTVGVVGGGGGMSNGTTMELSLYYRDAASNRVTVAATSITNRPALFPTNTHLLDFQVRVPTVKPGDAWAGRNIGIRLASTAGFDQIGGYWDLDNVRLRVFNDPALGGLTRTNGQTTFVLAGDPGRFEVLASTDVTLAPASWTNLGTVTNFTGAVSFTDTNASLSQRFYQARPAP